jgi:hypothetical protein
VANYYVRLSFLVDSPSPEASRDLRNCIEDPESRFLMVGGSKDLFDDEEVINIGTADIQGNEVWVHDEDGEAQVEYLADLLAAWQVKYNAPSIGFEYSYDCDKPRIDAYGGGAVYIKDGEQQWMTTSTWLATRGTEDISPKGVSDLLEEKIEKDNGG